MENMSLTLMILALLAVLSNSQTIKTQSIISTKATALLTFQITWKLVFRMLQIKLPMPTLNMTSPPIKQFRKNSTSFTEFYKKKKYLPTLTKFTNFFRACLEIELENDGTCWRRF